MDGLAWVEFLTLDQTVDADPPSPGRRTPSELVRSSVLDGAGVVAVHTSLHSAVGFDLGCGRYRCASPTSSRPSFRGLSARALPPPAAMV